MKKKIYGSVKELLSTLVLAIDFAPDVCFSNLNMNITDLHDPSSLSLVLLSLLHLFMHNA